MELFAFHIYLFLTDSQPVVISAPLLFLHSAGEHPIFFLKVAEKCCLLLKPTLTAISMTGIEDISRSSFAFSRRCLITSSITVIPFSALTNVLEIRSVPAVSFTASEAFLPSLISVKISERYPNPTLCFLIMVTPMP